ncbi:MAG: hypothetical protein ABSC13_06225 [Dehalococcoidia bacterium]|jgi:hypothetical protein
MDDNNNDGQEKLTTEVKPEAPSPVPEVSSSTATDDEAPTREVPLEKRAEDTEKAGDPETAKSLKHEADSPEKQSAGGDDGTAALLLLGVAALAVYILSQQKKPTTPALVLPNIGDRPTFPR